VRPAPRAALAATAVLAWAASAAGWWDVEWSSTTGAGTAVLSGVAATSGLARLLPLAALGGLLLTLTVGPAGRRVVAVLLAVLFGAVALLGVTHPRPDDALVADALGATLAATWTLRPTWVPWAYGLLGVLGASASAWLVVRPGEGRRAGVRPAGGGLEDSLASWKAMDEGRDPTAGEPAGGQREGARA